MADKLWIGTDGNYGTSGNWSPSGAPSTGDNVRIPRGGSSITSGLNQSSAAIGDFIVEEGFTGTIGSSAGYLQIDPNSFQFSGTGAAYIDVGSAAIPLDVKNTATAAAGYFGLYLKGSAITVLSVTKGSVGVAALIGETSTISSSLRLAGSSANATLGSGVTMTGTTVDVVAGNAYSYANLVTANVIGGTLTLYGTATLTTANVKGGTLYPNGSGTITTVNVGRSAGTVDFTGSGLAITVTNLNVYKGGVVKANPLRVTLTNDAVIQDVSTITAS